MFLSFYEISQVKILKSIKSYFFSVINCFNMILINYSIHLINNIQLLACHYYFLIRNLFIIMLSEIHKLIIYL